MTVLADLHTHSTASDGQYRPAELVRMARDRGIEVLALTDHDTLAGLDEAVLAGKELGVRVLRGVELSARERRTFHILSYGFDGQAPQLQALCRDVRQRREHRGLEIARYLAAKGAPVAISEVQELAGEAAVGRPHFVQVMVRRGYVSSPQEAFAAYLDTEEYHLRVGWDKPSARACIEAIRAAGGVASLAHPYQLGVTDDQLEALTAELAGYGLCAIECFYPRYTDRQAALYRRLAQRFGLYYTGGSDFHGERIKPEIQLKAVALKLPWLPAQEEI